VDRAPISAVGPRRRARPAISGETEHDKLGRIRRAIEKIGADALVLSDSHAVAWTFNIRGADVSHTPLPLSYALVPKDGRPIVFIDHRKLSNSARDHLERSADVDGAGRTRAQARRTRWPRRWNRARQRNRRRCLEPARRRRGRQTDARARSRQPAQSGQEQNRDRRHAKRRTGATRWRWCGSSPGSTAKRPRAR